MKRIVCLLIFDRQVCVFSCFCKMFVRIKNILDMIKNNYEREENSLILEKVKEVAQRLQSK